VEEFGDLGSWLYAKSKWLGSVIDPADESGVSADKGENTYLPFGAHRGMSEALVGFSKRAAAIDQACLSETRF